MRLIQSKTFFTYLFITSHKSSAFAFHPSKSFRQIGTQTQTRLNFCHSDLSKRNSNAFEFQTQNQFSTLTTLGNRFFRTNPTSSNSIMEPDISQATTRRMKALFSRERKSSGTTERDYSTKNRAKELKRLASSLDMDVPKLKELLRKQRAKMNDDDEKAKYVTWILENDKKRARKPSDATSSEEKKMETDDMEPAASASSKKVPKKARPIRSVSKVTKVEPRDSFQDHSASANNGANTVRDATLLSTMKFSDAPDLHPKSKKAIKEVLKLTHMTEIQSKTYGIAVQGTDVLGRARTGTGKTMAFLMPALECLLKSKQYQPGKNVGVLIISPTRELASQIGDQAEKLITFHKNLSCQVMYGGTKMGRDVNLLNKRLPSFLVATPGRLLDHMENTRLTDGRKFGYDVMRETQILVLDETDRLLDMGFRNEIKKILAYLPKQENRQTLLFSATVPQELKKIMAENMKKDYIEVDCIHDGGNNPDGGVHTNDLVKQTYTVLPNMQSQVTAVVQLVKMQMEKDPNHKIVVFFSTARMVGYFASFFNIGLGIDVIEIHSKKSQGYRNKASEKFRTAKRGALFTSDVSARGVDYPDVTSVIQVGLPENREQYIHRLGRTGRAGKEGEGILVLAPFEAKFVHELKNIEISENKEASELINGEIDPQTSKSIEKAMMRIRSGDATLTTSAEQAYAAFIGYYKGQMKRTTIRLTDDLVSTANTLAKVMGLKEIPGIPKRTIGKMGLKGVKGLVIMSEAEFRAKKGGPGGGRGGGRPGGGRGGGRGRGR